MEESIVQKNDSVRRFKKILPGSFKILFPLYITYIVFSLSVFLIFIPQQKKQLLDQKKETIHQLTNSAISLLSELYSRAQQGEISVEQAKSEAINQIRNLRYGPEGKDYFWINDMHPFMVMHPYRPDMEGKDLTLFKDPAGNYPFVAMVETVMNNQGGFVNYYWQWKDVPQNVFSKISFVKGFTPWGWIVGTGIYVDDIEREIGLITKNLLQIFTGILIFIIFLSVYISKQVFKVEQRRRSAEKKKELEELRLKKLLELSQMTEKSVRRMTGFALEEAIHLTGSDIGFLAFLNETETQLTMHTWSKQTMKDCEVEDKILIYNVTDTGLWAEAARSRKTVIINDYENFDSSQKKGYPKGHVRISRVLNVPIFDGEKMVALAGVGNKKENYDESDVRQLKLMMDGMWKIIQRKNAEEDLRRSEERYRLIADNATDTIWIMQISDFTFSYVSPSVKYLLGYNSDQFVKLGLEHVLSKRSIQEVRSAISKELEFESQNKNSLPRNRALEIEMIKQDGSTIWAEVTARFLVDDGGTPDRVLGITRDITQRRELEKRLKQINTDLSLAQQISGIGNWSVDPESGVQTWSEELYEIHERDPKLGPYSYDELKTLYPGKWSGILDSATQEAISNGTPYNIELKLTLPSGNIKWVNSICEPVFEQGAYSLHGTVQDITERKNLESRIQQVQKMEALGTLAGGIAHDFNNILSSIIGFAELAKLDLHEDEEAKNNLDQVLTAGLRARDLVKHILTFSRKADAQKTMMQIVPLIKECLKFLKASISPNIELRYSFERTDIMVLSDPTQLHQILMNLFTNAAYAMKEKGGILDVKLDSIHILKNDMFQMKKLVPGKYIHLVISDTGSGIPKDLTEKIFEPFFTTKGRGEGTGMGLSTVYGIIKEMKGDISVYSEEGAGSTFRILIPEVISGTQVETDHEQIQLITGKGKILLVDDEMSIIDWTSQVLLKLGYEVITACNGIDAVDQFLKSPSSYDLVLSDLAMPEISGIDLSKRIRMERPDIPIILCTGFSDGLTSDIIQNYGISSMIMKPLIASELSQAISTALDNNSNKD